MVVETVELFFFFCTEKDKKLLDIQIEMFPPKAGVVGRRGRGREGALGFRKMPRMRREGKEKEQVSTNLLLPGERHLGKKEISS